MVRAVYPIATLFLFLPHVVGVCGSGKFSASENFAKVSVANASVAAFQRTPPLTFSFLFDSTIDLEYNGLRALPSGILQDASVGVGLIQLDFSHNLLPVLPSYLLRGVHFRLSDAPTAAIVLNFKDNRITVLGADTFLDSFFVPLTSLDLSDNLLTVLTTSTMQALPRATDVSFKNNRIQAVPVAGNFHVEQNDSMSGNVIACRQYGPVSVTGCGCGAGYEPSEHCGYARCLRTANGCSNASIFNSTDCDAAPFSTCIDGSVDGFYYNALQGAFQPLTDCSTEFATIGQRAYEVKPPSTTTDRLCSICSSCPHGYQTSPCSATTDATCTQGLSSGDIAAILLAVLILAAAVVMVTLCVPRCTKKNPCPRRCFLCSC